MKGTVMKSIIRKWTLTLVAVVMIGTLGQAQSIDTNRMNRDIKIMENILGELFKINSPSVRSNGESRAFTIASGFGTTDVKGTYLPGYGIIFTIPQISSHRISSVNVNKSEGSSQISFYYSSDEDEDTDPVTEESVINRITEFLTDYASTIGQLKEDENVMVIYGPKTGRSSVFAVYTLRGDKIDKDEVAELPVISVVAKKSDLQALRNGSINEDTFEDRLSISKSQDKEYLDLKVMSNIFETALKEVPRESYRLSGNVDYLMLENFGVLFSVNVRYDLHGRTESFFIRNNDRNRLTYTAAQSQANTSSDNDDAEELEEKISNAYEKLVQDIKEYIIDYGRTLNSVKSGQYILTSVNLSDTWIDNNLPDRIDFQVQKSTLEQLDRGGLSRQEAINSVTVTEY